MRTTVSVSRCVERRLPEALPGLVGGPSVSRPVRGLQGPGLVHESSTSPSPTSARPWGQTTSSSDMFKAPMPGRAECVLLSCLTPPRSTRSWGPGAPPPRPCWLFFESSGLPPHIQGTFLFLCSLERSTPHPPWLPRPPASSQCPSCLQECCWPGQGSQGPGGLSCWPRLGSRTCLPGAGVGGLLSVQPGANGKESKSCFKEFASRTD